jgi:hypothetical protein
MLTIQELNRFLDDPAVSDNVTQVWTLIGQHFEQAQANLPAEHAMQRRELSFHDHVRLLGYLCLLLEGIPGDLVEIQTRRGLFIYRITGSRVTEPTDRTVLVNGTEHRLALTTCYPLWAGAFATQRLVFFATQLRSTR